MGDVLIHLRNTKAGWGQKQAWVEIVDDPDRPIQVRWRGWYQRHTDSWMRTNGVQVALDWLRRLIDEADDGEWTYRYPGEIT
jgi:hypothetical protein